MKDGVRAWITEEQVFFTEERAWTNCKELVLSICIPIGHFTLKNKWDMAWYLTFSEDLRWSHIVSLEKRMILLRIPNQLDSLTWHKSWTSNVSPHLFEILSKCPKRNTEIAWWYGWTNNQSDRSELYEGAIQRINHPEECGCLLSNILRKSQLYAPHRSRLMIDS